MKNLMTAKMSILALLTMLFLYTSCADEKSQNEELDNFLPKTETKLDYAPFDIIGVKHNQIVFAFTEQTNCNEQLYGQYHAMLNENFGAEYNQYKNFYDNLSQSETANYLSIMQLLDNDGISDEQLFETLQLSFVTKQSFDELFSLVHEEMNYASFLEGFNALMQNKKEELSNSDLVRFYTAAAVLKNSAKLWLPAAQGGLSWMDNICSQEGVMEAEGRSVDPCDPPSPDCDPGVDSGWNWGKIILHDARGAATAVAIAITATNGAAAVPNPAFGGIPTAGVIGLIGGVGVSIGAGINEWMPSNTAAGDGPEPSDANCLTCCGGCGGPWWTIPV